MAALWREAGLSWKDFLPEEDDVHAFLMEQVRGACALSGGPVGFPVEAKEGNGAWPWVGGGASRIERFGGTACQQLPGTPRQKGPFVTPRLQDGATAFQSGLEFLAVIFVTLQKLDFTETDSSSSSEALSKKELSAEELNRQLEKLIVEEEAGDEQIFDWVEV